MILRAISKNVKISILDSSEVVKKAILKTNLNMIYSNQVSKMISMGIILSQGLKSDKMRLSLNLLNDEVIEKIIVKTTLDNKIALKTIINKEKEEKLFDAINHNNYEIANKLLNLENAKLEIVMDYGLKQPYKSTFNVEDSLLELTLNEYLNKSEQTKSIFISSIEYDENGNFLNSGAILIQNLPNADDKIIEFLASKLERVTSIAKMLKNKFSLEKIAYLIFENDFEIIENESKYLGLPFDKLPLIEELKILDIRDFNYGCDCSKEYMIRALKVSVSEKELKEILEEDGKIEISCNFCDKKYIFNNIEELNYE